MTGKPVATADQCFCSLRVEELLGVYKPPLNLKSPHV